MMGSIPETETANSERLASSDSSVAPYNGLLLSITCRSVNAAGNKDQFIEV